MNQSIYETLYKLSSSAVDVMNEYDFKNHLYGDYINQDTRILHCHLVKDEYNMLSFIPSEEVIEEFRKLLNKPQLDANNLIHNLIEDYSISASVGTCFLDDDKPFFLLTKAVRYEKAKLQLQQALSDSTILLSQLDVGYSDMTMIDTNFEVIKGIPNILSEPNVAIFYNLDESLMSNLNSLFGIESVLQIEDTLNKYGLNYMFTIVSCLDMKNIQLPQEYENLFIKKIMW